LTQRVEDDTSVDDLVDDSVDDNDIIELTEQLVEFDEPEPITGASTGNKDSISEAQMRSVLEKIIEEKYGDRMDDLFSDIIHKLVEKEMEKIKISLLNALEEK